MAATDQTYRSQRTLDIVFAVSCILMLVSVIWMFAQDYFREFKVEQRDFRDVETALAERQALDLVPDDAKMQQIEAAEQNLHEKIEARNAKQRELRPKLKSKLTDKVRKEAQLQGLKADLDSQVSLYNIAVEHRDAYNPGTSEYQVQDQHVKDRLATVEDLQKKYGANQLELEKIDRDYKELQDQEKPFIAEASKAEDEWKLLTADFDRFAKLTAQKRWKTGDWVRALPVLDAFASPTRIQQFTLDQLPIDYAFKYVTRYDRCTTCHQGIDRPSFTREAIEALKEPATEEQRKKLQNAKAMLRKRQQILSSLEWSFTDKDLPDLHPINVPEPRVGEFAAHPRLDLFAHPNSPHGAEKFGCSICHAGQGSATDFVNATHTPNGPKQQEEWIRDKHWESIHFWDFPMLPKRFVESSCLKCHYNVVDLLPEGEKMEIRAGKRTETPGAKVVKGYNIVRELGCFGCHEISGIKDNRWVGPDLRLEPNPPLEELTPEQRVKATADPLNPPGTMRKVGPSLRRLSEKTNDDWVRKWIDLPRGFRPDTKMPHFFHLSNNDESVLPSDQKGFPAATIHAVTYYLFEQSKAYVAQAGKLPEPNLPADYKEDKARGRTLFSERGCLVCHAHDAVTKPGDNLPPIPSEQHFGPNLSRLAGKLGVKPGDTASARKWLIQWIKDPKQYHPRTFMPVTHLTDADAADLAAWLLSQSADWKGEDVPNPANDTYVNLAKVFLNKAMSRLDVEDIFPNGAIAGDKLQAVIDDADKKLTEKLEADGKLKYYIGKKSINQLGCFACHDIPGFEMAKPIGTPLNDWGKKDPERLAFEDVQPYVKERFHDNFVDAKVNPETGLGWPGQDGREPYETFYYEGLGHEHATRQSFLYQKLREPRAYDYDRLKAWDDRLRMPQFRFTRGVAKPLEGETPEQAQHREEAESREAVMTFVLGLVAEPVPLKFVYDPPGDRMAEVQGKKVIDKFNCAGCHQIRPGSYEFNAAPKVVDGESRRVVLDELVSAHRRAVNSNAYKGDHVFKEHNAWTGTLSSDPNRVKLYGLPFGRPDADTVNVRLTQAVRFNRPEDADLKADERDKKALDIPAAESLALPAAELLFQAAPLGGTFAELLTAYLVARKIPELPDEPACRSTVPPPLLREGEKVQPGWLFQFLKDPYPIRPEQRMRLRMPKFSLSDDEARALVHYFAAADRTTNSGIGLQYPYAIVPQRDEGYFKAHAAQYLAKLKKEKGLEPRQKELEPLWKKQLPEQVAQYEEKIKQAKASVEKAADATAKTSAENELRRLQGELKNLQDMKTQVAGWENEKVYLTDAYRLVVNNNICLTCHQVGIWGKEPPIGPRLDHVNDRMRPDWMLRWIASPERLLIYPVGIEPMPKNFPKDRPQFQEIFLGTPFDQVTAVRDLLMVLPRAQNMPENQAYRPPEGAPAEGEKK